MKQSLANSTGRNQPALVSPTLPTLLVLGVDAATALDGRGLSRAPWVMRVVVEAIEDALRDVPAKYFDGAHRVGRGVVDAAVQPIVHALVETGHLVPVGVGASAMWQVGHARRVEIGALWRAISPPVASAVRVAAQRAVAIDVALSKTARASIESRMVTSVS